MKYANNNKSRNRFDNYENRRSYRKFNDSENSDSSSDNSSTNIELLKEFLNIKKLKETKPSNDLILLEINNNSHNNNFEEKNFGHQNINVNN